MDKIYRILEFCCIFGLFCDAILKWLHINSLFKKDKEKKLHFQTKMITIKSKMSKKYNKIENINKNYNKKTLHMVHSQKKMYKICHWADNL